MTRCPLQTCVMYALALLSSLAHAQTYPSRTITIIQPLAAGGPSDIEARIIAAKIQERLKVTTIVESRPGAGTLVGTNIVAKATPDGYTLGHLYLSQYSNVFNKDGPADPLQHFEIIGSNWIAPFVLSVNNETSKAKTLAEFIAYAKANQGKLNYANTSNTVRLTQETFNKLAGIQMQGIDYKGNSQASTALLANEVQSYFGTVGGAAANTKTGKVVVLGVADDKRMPGLPDVPTMTEQGYPVKAYLTGAVYAPAGVPKNVVTILEPIVREAVVSTEMERVILQQRGRALTVTREEYAKILRDEIDFWRGAAKANNFQPQ